MNEHQQHPLHSPESYPLGDNYKSEKVGRYRKLFLKRVRTHMSSAKMAEW